MVKTVLFKVDYSVIDYDYKFKIKVSRPLLMSKRTLERRFQRVLQHFSNFSVFWEDEWTYIINLYFDGSGWDKDRESRSHYTSVYCDGSVGYVSFKWTEDK